MHPQFRDFNSRLWIMGDYGETAFKDFAAHNDLIPIRFGLDRPPYRFFPQLSPILRATPDFLVETGRVKLVGLLTKQPGDDSRSTVPRHFLCEVKGCGKDQVFKLKDEQIEAWRMWQVFTNRPMMFFLYNQPDDKISFSLSLDRLGHILPTLERGYFVDSGKRKDFYKLPVTHPYLRWEDPCPTTTASPAGASISTAV